MSSGLTFSLRWVSLEGKLGCTQAWPVQFEILPRMGNPFSQDDLFQRSAAVTVTNLFFVPKQNFPCCNLCLSPPVLLQRVSEGGKREEGWNSVQSQPSAGTGCKEEEKRSQSMLLGQVLVREPPVMRGGRLSGRRCCSCRQLGFHFVTCLCFRKQGSY